MAVSVSKGQRVSLEKVAPGLLKVFVGLGCDVKATDTDQDFDLDSSLLLLLANAVGAGYQGGLQPLLDRYS